MTTTAVTLPDTTYAVISAIAQQTGKTEADIVQDAVQHYIAQFQHANRKQLLRQARGMWEHRSDLPDAVALRRELERDQTNQ